MGTRLDQIKTPDGPDVSGAGPEFCEKGIHLSAEFHTRAQTQMSPKEKFGFQGPVLVPLVTIFGLTIFVS